MAVISGKGPHGEHAGRILKKTPNGALCVVAVITKDGDGSFDVAGATGASTEIMQFVAILRQIANEMEESLIVAARMKPSLN